IEYGVELSLGKNIANGNFNLQSGWLINQYQHQDTMVNFQIWASNPTVTKYLLTEILSKANQKYPILNNQNFTFPKVYVTKIRRQQNKLLVYINNTTNQPVLDIKWCEKANEQTKFDTLFSQIVSKENSTSVLTFWIDDKYELDLYLTINDILYDKVYFADANWGLDFDNTYTSINKFQVLNSPNKNYNLNNFYLYRNVNLQANTEDYISIYKDLIAGHLPTNLTAYNGLEFFAKGKGKMLIRLSSSQINNWRAQYKTYINLPEDGAL